MYPPFRRWNAVSNQEFGRADQAPDGRSRFRLRAMPRRLYVKDDCPPEQHPWVRNSDMIFSGVYQSVMYPDQVIQDYWRIFGGCVGHRGACSWGTKDVNNTLAGLRGVFKASWDDQLVWQGMNMYQTALSLTAIMAKRFAGDEAPHLMDIIQKETANYSFGENPKPFPIGKKWRRRTNWNDRRSHWPGGYCNAHFGAKAAKHSSFNATARPALPSVGLDTGRPTPGQTHDAQAVPARGGQFGQKGSLTMRSSQWPRGRKVSKAQLGQSHQAGCPAVNFQPVPGFGPRQMNICNCG